MSASFPKATYNATPPAVTDKQDINLQCDTGGNLKVLVTPSSSTTTSNAAAGASSVVVKNAAGKLLRLRASNLATGVAGWVMIFGAAALPANGATPIWRRPIGAAGSELVEDFAALGGLSGAAGIVVALSTTETTLTIGAATMLVDAVYV